MLWHGAHSEMDATLGLLGDFYQEADVTRSCMVDCNVLDWQAHFGKHVFDVPVSSPWKDHSLVQQLQRSEERSEERFWPTDEAPGVPTESGNLGMTTCSVYFLSAPDVGNRLLDFFGVEEGFHVTKVNRTKFKIKVVALACGLVCELKVIIYRHVTDGATVEFRRESGDVVAFNDVYCRASQCLTMVRTNNREDGTHKKIRLNFSQAFSGHMPEVQDSLEPLLQMAGCEQNPELQAQAASGLYSIAQDPQMTARLCTPVVLAVIQNLLSVHHLAVVYPTACFLSAIAQFQAGRQCCYDLGLPQLMRAKLHSKDTAQLAKQQLELAMLRINSCGVDVGEERTKRVSSDFFQSAMAF